MKVIQSNFKKVDTWIDIVKNEHEVLDFWKDAQITPGKFSNLKNALDSHFDVYYFDAINQLDRALKRCYGNRDISLQQLSATFRRTNLLEMIHNES